MKKRDSIYTNSFYTHLEARMALCTLWMHVFPILARKAALLYWCSSAFPTVSLQPQFPPPSVIKIPMESVQTDPQNGIHCISSK